MSCSNLGKVNITAKIAIMNKEAMALASDSTVTSIQENGQKSSHLLINFLVCLNTILSE